MIGYYVHHQGSGHARRATAVARELASLPEPVEVTGLGSGGRPEGWPGRWIDLPHDAEPQVDPATSDVTAHGRLHWVPPHHPGLAARHRVLATWAADERPDLVVVDTSVEVTALLRLCGVPVVVGAMPGDRTDAPHTLAYDLADALLAPWPEGAHPDAGWPQAWLDKTWHVGGISTLTPAPAPAPRPTGTAAPGRADGIPQVLVVWGRGGAGVDGEALAAARAATPDWGWTVRGGDAPPSPDLAAELAAADVVVCHAGQGAVADVATAGRPAVVVAQPRPYDEQLATARAVDRLGCAVGLEDWPAADAWPDLLERAVDLDGAGWSRWLVGGGAPAAGRRLAEMAGR